MATLCDICTNMLYAQTEAVVPDIIGNGRRHHPNLSSLQKALEKGCSICSIVIENARLDALKQGKTKCASKTDDLMGPGTSLSFRLYHEESTSKLNIMKLDVTVWSSSFSSITRFRLLPDSDRAMDRVLPQAGNITSTGSTSTLRLAHDWFLSCHACHVQCKSIEPSNFEPAWLPSRLLDVGIQENESIKLVLTRHDAIEPQAQYMTLSYRWGTEAQKLLLQYSNMDLFRQGIPIHGLPQTFQDVVIAVRAFGIRYVWIDALCIIQDSPEDWEREGAMMRDVYTNSACTIAATASESPDQGLFRCRDPATILPKRITAPSVGPRPNNDVEYLLFDRSFLERRIFDGPLHMRGWVFQERMLSPRVLHFTKDQLVWECFTETKCETFPKGMPLQIHTKELGPRQSGNQMANTIEGGTQASATSSSHSLQSSTECNLTDWRTLSTWRELVKQYSKCDLTYTTDKLPALAGLAKAYQDTTGDAYLAGLWRSFLLDQLDWRVYTPGGRVSSQYRAPSWSWASVDSPVRPFMLNPRSLFLPVINNIQVKTRGPEYFGRTLTAYLDLEGYLIHASIHSLDDERIACQLQVGKHIVSGQLLRDTADTDFILGSAIICLPLKIDAMAPDMYPLKDLVLFCMVLEPIHGTKSVEYQRVALLIVSAEGQQLEPFRSFGISINQDSTFEVTEDYSIIRIV